MRIDFVITELFVGGAEKCLTEIALTMHQRGDRVRVFSLASLPTGEQRGLVERLQAAGITVQSAQCNSLWQAVSAYKFLKKQFTDDTPDVVQTFLHHANVIGAYASTSANVTKCVAAIRVAQENRWRNQLEKISLKQVDHTLCVSRAVSQFAHRILGCNPSNTSVIPNGVNLDQFAQHRPASWEAFDWPSDSRVALFIGRLDHQKGLELLQEQIDPISVQSKGCNLSGKFSIGFWTNVHFSCKLFQPYFWFSSPLQCGEPASDVLLQAIPYSHLRKIAFKWGNIWKKFLFLSAENKIIALS